MSVDARTRAARAEERTLQHALRRGYLTADGLAQARRDSAAAGVPLLAHLRRRYLRPEQTAELEQVYRASLAESDRPRVLDTAAGSGGGGAGRGAALAPGALVGGYELVAELARGGMGVVYRARHPRLEREVALKVLLAGEGASPAQRERFLLEAQAAARLRHPGVVTIYDVGQDGERPFLVMDLVEGESLAGRLEREGPLEPRAAAALLRDVAEALACAHDHLVLHRDLKPGNILLDVQGRPKLTDFGLAKRLDPEELSGPTITGQLVGTPAYMAPEQAAGGSVDFRTDVYALGATAYELLTGELVFEGSMLELLAQVASAEPRPPARIRPADLPPLDPDLETIVLRCLEKEPAARYATARALADDLERYLRDEPIEARRPGPADRLVRWARRNPGAARVAFVGGVVLPVLVLAGGWWASRAARSAARTKLVAEARLAAEDAAGQLGALDAAASADERTAAALAAQQAAHRWRVLAPDEPAAAEAYFAAAMALGEVALASEQWALAARAFAKAEAAGVDAAAARARVAEVERTRRVEAERRARAVTELLARARNGELNQTREGVLEAAFQIVRYADAQTVGLVADALDEVRRALEAGRPLAPAQEDVARLCCEALGRIGIREGAVEPLARYLKAERDQLRAIAAGEALVRLGGEEALHRVHDARGRFGTNGVFARAIQRSLAEAAPTEVPEHDHSHDHGEAERWLDRTDILLAQGDFEGALETATRAIAAAPDDPHAWDMRGLAYRELNRLDLALADLTRAIELDPDDPGSWSNRGDVKRGMGDLVGAREDFERALEVDPTFALGWSNLAMVKGLEGDHQGSIVDATRALELDPSHPNAWQERGRARARLGQLQAAAADLTRAIELDPARAAPIYNERAMVKIEQGDFQGALEDLQRGIELDPEGLPLYMNRGLLRADMGDLEGALSDLDRCLRLDPADPDTYYNRASVRRGLGDLDGAFADYTRAIELDPEYGQAYVNRALILLERGEPQRALEELTRAIEVAPGVVQAWANRGFLRADHGDLAGGVEDLSRAIELAPEEVPLLFSRGWMLVELGRAEEARADLERFLRSAPPGHPGAAQARELLERLGPGR